MPGVQCGCEAGPIHQYAYLRVDRLTSDADPDQLVPANDRRPVGNRDLLGELARGPLQRVVGGGDHPGAAAESSPVSDSGCCAVALLQQALAGASEAYRDFGA